MAFVPGIDQFSVRWDFTLNGDGASIGMYVLDDDPLTPGRIDTLATLSDDWMTLDVLPSLSNEALYNGVTVYDLNTVTSPVRSIQKSPAVAGGVATPCAPNNAAVVVTFKTAGRGRSSRGRIYFVGLGEANIQQNQWDALTAAAVADWIVDFQTRALAANFTHIVSSSILEGSERTERLAQTVTEVVGKTKVGTQRRRINYGSGS